MNSKLENMKLLKLSIVLISLLSGSLIKAENGISLYTPYKKIEVPPGETISYNIEINNIGNTTNDADIIVSGLPKSWNYTIKTGGYSIKELSVQPKAQKNVKLTVSIPLKVNKGNYHFKVLARNKAELPLTITVSEKGIYQTEFTTDQVNMQGNSKSNFSFNTRLRNQTAEKQIYSLQAAPPQGWQVIFKPNHKQATAVEVEPNAISNISIEIKPPYNVIAGSYKIPVNASNRNTNAEIELEVIITGTYDISVSTPNGLLSANITAGKEKSIDLQVTNTGSADLKNIRLIANKPKNWEVTFKTDTIALLKPGTSTVVQAKIKAYEKAIPGDYVTNIGVKANEVTSSASFRISVKTSLLWGWMGIFIIIICVGLIIWLFRKYGRR